MHSADYVPDALAAPWQTRQLRVRWRNGVEQAAKLVRRRSVRSSVSGSRSCETASWSASVESAKSPVIAFDALEMPASCTPSAGAASRATATAARGGEARGDVQELGAIEARHLLLDRGRPIGEASSSLAPIAGRRRSREWSVGGSVGPTKGSASWWRLSSRGRRSRSFGKAGGGRHALRRELV